MSFLAGRLASKEGSFFLQESKHAAARLAQRLPSPPSPSSSPPASSSSAAADVLPEVLRHSLPLKTDRPSSLSTLSAYSKWSLPNSSDPSSRRSLDAVNPLRAFVSLPPVTFGPRRWSLPNSDQSIPASTANELRRDKATNSDAKKLRAMAEGISQIGKAFVVATMIVFGAATITFAFAASQLDLQSNEDIKVKGKSLLQPKFEGVKACFTPLRTWVESISKHDTFDGPHGANEKPLIRELSKRYGRRVPE
ncbi:uncharacterized protein LOC116258128 [Nymphaea colorata]|nr:uncharacterized protein LOC116245316 [Nymphaea colorata]XP_031491115.1 uncharacterized protein LOC116258128 [Nymphaea colorata]